MIVVTGSTGNGQPIDQGARGPGVPTRALVHTPEKLAAVELEGVEAMVCDFGTPETLDAALEGAERAFLLTPADLRQPEWEKNFVQAAQRAGVGHVVKQSVQGLMPTLPCASRASMTSASDSKGLVWLAPLFVPTCSCRPRSPSQRRWPLMGGSTRRLQRRRPA
jgi:hypothetical protein